MYASGTEENENGSLLSTEKHHNNSDVNSPAMAMVGFGLGLPYYGSPLVPETALPLVGVGRLWRGRIEDGCDWWRFSMY